MNNAVVTGATGFIGRALLEVLNRQKVTTFAVVRNEQKRAIWDGAQLPYIHVIYCDMDKIEDLTAILKENIDAFFHLAWDGSSGENRKDYRKQLRNVQWTIDAARVAGELGAKRFIGAGSLVEYDAEAYIPTDGASPDLVSFYATAKITAHYMSKIVCSQYLSMAHCWAILSHIYGKGNYSTNFVNFAVKCMLTGQPANFTRGKQMTDFVSIENTVWGLYCIGNRGHANTSYYVGSNHPRTLREYIQIIRNTIDPHISLNLGAVPFRGVVHPAETFDCTKVMRDTGYEPIGSFEEEIKSVVSWISEQISCGKL